MNTTIGDFYQKKSEEYTSELTAVIRQVRWFGWYRFFAFILIFLPVLIFGVKNLFAPLTSFLALIVFSVLVKKNIQLENKKKKLKILKKLVDDEILAINHQFSHFKNGSEFFDTNHFFSYDLDLFGEGSLYQFLNRTTTRGGAKKLAKWLMNPLVSKDEIEKRQKAVKEFSEDPEWRLQFLAEGMLFEESDELSDEIISWSGMEMKLNNAPKIKWIIRIIPLLTMISAVPALLGISNVALILFILSQWVLISMFFWKRISEYFQFFGRKSELLAKYMKLLHAIENADFQSEYLKELQQKVTSPQSAGKVFSQLKSLVKEFEYRQNLLVGIFLNSLFLWDIRCVYHLWNWHRKNHKKLAVWLDTVAEFDALISLGNYANNHPDFVYPEIGEGEFTFSSKNLGHPLLHPQKRVNNDFEMNGWSQVMIVTGANMAGKSTFLRTVGVNLILGRLGTPVCAEKMVFTPVEIYTNMRTTDSLLKDESYFFAELKRIQGVLERLQNGERIFIILDEMLKGTNSVDKLEGSKKLIRKLLLYQSVSLIATHDLKLSELEREFPDQVKNACFEIRIENDEMVFDYKLSDGVTQTMNATFLMKKMGII